LSVLNLTFYPALQQKPLKTQPQKCSATFSSKPSVSVFGGKKVTNGNVFLLCAARNCRVVSFNSRLLLKSAQKAFDRPKLQGQIVISLFNSAGVKLMVAAELVGRFLNDSMVCQ
jgi:hypothetical protein